MISALTEMQQSLGSYCWQTLQCLHITWLLYKQCSFHLLHVCLANQKCISLSAQKPYDCINLALYMTSTANDLNNVSCDQQQWYQLSNIKQAKHSSIVHHKARSNSSDLLLLSHWQRGAAWVSLYWQGNLNSNRHIRMKFSKSTDFKPVTFEPASETHCNGCNYVPWRQKVSKTSTIHPLLSELHPSRQVCMVKSRTTL